MRNHLNFFPLLPRLTQIKIEGQLQKRIKIELLEIDYNIFIFNQIVTKGM